MNHLHLRSSLAVSRPVTALVLCLLSCGAPLQAAGEQIDRQTLDRWAAPYRNWHYQPDHVIPARPNIPGHEKFINADVPTIYQLPGSDKWYMSFIAFNGQGYNSFVAQSDDLLHWSNYRLAMGFGPKGEFDHGGCVLGAYLYRSYDIKAPRLLKQKDGKFWSLYGCYPRQGGYELRPGYEGVAVSDDGLAWRRARNKPILSVHDPDRGEWEQSCIYQPWLVEHDGRYFNFYNAANGGFEQLGAAFSTDLLNWTRHKANPVVANRPGGYDARFASDGKVFRDGDHWTMFYFGVGRGGAHIMIAFSRDLVNWTAHPEPLYKAGGNPSGLDKKYAHKISLVWNPESETWYLFYCAVGNKGRGIGLITSKPLHPNAQSLSRTTDAPAPKRFILDTTKLKNYVAQFNADDEELYANIPNADALAFLEENIPLFECPDKDFERTCYFRWWTYRKHVKRTPDGYVITEFLPKVSWSGKHNTISCPAGHHFYEGRWLRNSKYLDDYAVFWFRKGGSPRSYSFWAADAIYHWALATGDFARAIDLLPDLIANYQAWEKSRLDPNGMFWQIDDRDGMEVSIGGSVSRGRGYRATINSYMYGDAVAIAKIAQLAGRTDIAKQYNAKAAKIRNLVQTKLWDTQAKFFKVLPRVEQPELVDVREQHGYTPWYFNLPEPGKGYEVAWKQLMDPKGFYAPFGPTTAEQRHPRFAISYKGHPCQWNGPSWPLSTSVTLTALANVLNNYDQNAVSRKDYFETLKIYTRSHRLKRDNGKVVPWIDENLNPHTGDWIARTRLKSSKNGTWDPGKGGKERGKDYNHSSYNDLIITGLVGLRPRPDNIIEVNPLLPDGTWDYFCLDDVRYRGRTLTILWDKTGKKYGKGPGLRVFVDGKQIAHSPTLTRLTAPAP